jgi:hypothetical protein
MTPYPRHVETARGALHEVTISVYDTGDIDVVITDPEGIHSRVFNYGRSSIMTRTDGYYYLSANRDDIVKRTMEEFSEFISADHT